MATPAPVPSLDQQLTTTIAAAKLKLATKEQASNSAGWKILNHAIDRAEAAQAGTDTDYQANALIRLQGLV